MCRVQATTEFDISETDVIRKLRDLNEIKKSEQYRTEKERVSEPQNRKRTRQSDSEERTEEKRPKMCTASSKLFNFNSTKPNQNEFKFSEAKKTKLFPVFVRPVSASKPEKLSVTGAGMRQKLRAKRKLPNQLMRNNVKGDDGSKYSQGSKIIKRRQCSIMDYLDGGDKGKSGGENWVGSE